MLQRPVDRLEKWQDSTWWYLPPGLRFDSSATCTWDTCCIDHRQCPRTGSSSSHARRTVCVQWESKKTLWVFFWHFFPNSWEFLLQILQAYYMFLSTTGVQIFIQLAATLCHIKRDHYNAQNVHHIGRNARWVVAFNMT